MPIVYLALGSNIEPRATHLTQAFKALEKEFPKFFRASSIYHTKPYQGLKQPGYLNACVSFESDLEPAVLLNVILKLEARLGRIRSGQKWDSRVIDIDIVFHGQHIVDQPGLKVPHYDVSNRDFFLIPLLDLNDVLNPESGNTLSLELKEIPEDKRTWPTLWQEDAQQAKHA